MAETMTVGRELAAPRPVKWIVFDGGVYDWHRNVYIEERQQRNGSYLFAVTQLGEVLNKDGEWEYEPQPSSRDDDFMARTRFATWIEAREAFRRSLIQQGPNDG